MIGLDTNVLVRYIMQDDAKQSRKAGALIESLTEDAPGFVTLVALIELAWVLESVYGLSRAQVAEALGGLLAISVIKIERVAVAAAALRSFRDGGTDFADCLIERVSAANGCERTKTFDRAAVKSAGMVLIA